MTPLHSDGLTIALAVEESPDADSDVTAVQDLQRLENTLTRKSGIIQRFAAIVSVFKPRETVDENDEITPARFALSAGVVVGREVIDHLPADKLPSLVQPCRDIVKVLDTVSQVHPFVGLAVTGVKLALVMLSKLSDNDRRIVVIIESMKDMFDVLAILKEITPSHIKKVSSGEDRLRKQMGIISRDVRACIEACDTYKEKRPLIRFLLCHQWEDKLTSYIATFRKHKEDLDRAIHLLTLAKVHSISNVIGGIVSGIAPAPAAHSSTSAHEPIRMDALRSPEEAAVLSYVEKAGGLEEFETSDKMADLLERSEKLGFIRNPRATNQRQMVEELVGEVKKSFDDMIRENQDQFERKLEVQGIAIVHLQRALTKEADRIIDRLTAGPHQKIHDPDISVIWKGMNCQATTDAHTFVMAVREYYAEYAAVLNEKQHRSYSRRAWDFVTLDSAAGWGMTPRGITREDAWTLDYITISRIQPLMEAFDDDTSGLVSISEVNAFTTMRPPDYSLPKWIAYWTIGFPLTVQHYFGLIQLLMARLPIVIADVLAVNRQLIDHFTTHWTVYELDLLLAGVQRSLPLVKIEEYDKILTHFKRYIDDQEKTLHDALERVEYCVDAENTLSLVIENGRLEKHVMTLLYLVFRQFYRIVRYAKDKPLHVDAITNLTESLETIYDVLARRLRHVKALSRFQNVDVAGQLTTFAHGMYYYLEYPEKAPASRYWKAIYFNKDLARTEMVLDTELMSKHLQLAGAESYRPASIGILEDGETAYLPYPPPDLDVHIETEAYDNRQHGRDPFDFWKSGWMFLRGEHSVKDDVVDLTSSTKFLDFIGFEIPPSMKQFRSRPINGVGYHDGDEYTVAGEARGIIVTLRLEYHDKRRKARFLRGIMENAGIRIEKKRKDPAMDVGADFDDGNHAPCVSGANSSACQYTPTPVRFSFITVEQEMQLESTEARARWLFAFHTIRQANRIRKRRLTRHLYLAAQATGPVDPSMISADLSLLAHGAPLYHLNLADHGSN